MKKTLLTLATVVASLGFSFAQEPIAPTKLRKTSLPIANELEHTAIKKNHSVAKSSATSSPSTASVKDTVNYYFNKYFFMTPADAVPYPRAVRYPMGGQLADDNIYSATNRYVNGHPISITTAGTILWKAEETSPNVTVSYSLCNLSSSGAPVFPAVAVSDAVVTSTVATTVYANFNPPVTFTSNFAIVVSVKDGSPKTDSIYIAMYRAASIPTNTVGVPSWTCTPYDFYEPNCLMRYGNGNGGASPTYTANYQTRFGESNSDNLGLAKFQYHFNFGIETNVVSNYTVSAVSSSCAPSTYTISNISSNIFGNPVFNFNKFVDYWGSKISPIDGSTFDDVKYPFESVYLFDAGKGDAAEETNTSATKFAPTYAAGSYTASLVGNYRTMYNGVKHSDTVRLPITISALPNPDVALSLNTINSQCLNTSSVTLAGGLPSGGVYSGKGVSSGIFNPAVAGVGTHTLTYTFVDNNNCTGSSKDVITVKAPTVTVSGLNKVCAGNTVTLTASGTATNYAWSSGISDGVAFTPTSTSSYSVVGTDADGCSKQTVFTVTVNALPNVIASSDKNEVCNGNTVKLTASGAQTYTWSNGVANGAVFTPTATATYSVVGKNLNGCIKDAVVTVTVNALPSVSLSLNAINSQCINSNSVSLTGGLPSGGVYSGTGVNSDIFDPSVAGVGTYTLTYTYTDNNQCVNSATDVMTVDACTGLNTLSTSNFVVYPNPSNGVIAIKNLTNNSTVELVNILGEVLYKGKVSGDATTLDFSSLPTANYYLKVTNAEGQSTVKKLQFN